MRPERLPDELPRCRAHQCCGRALALVLEEVAERHAIRLQQLVLPHPLVVEDLREIALSGVAQEGHDERVGIVHLARDLQRDVRDQPRRAADEQPLLAREPARHRERVAIAHRPVVVDHREIERAGQLVLSDPLDLVRRPLRPMRAPLLRHSSARIEPCGSPAMILIFGLRSFR